MLSQSERQFAIDQAIDKYAHNLNEQPGSGINPVAILKAIAHIESTYGEQWYASLHEKAYCYGGKYHNDDLRRLSKMWGCHAHSSQGPWQILYITAYEMGFRDDPIRLRDATISIEYVISLINRRVMDKLTDETPRDIFDAYNSGRPRDRIIPEDYINDATEHYRMIA